eukprot:6179214-Pleurochrysis_carterae.AAC.2
MASKAPQTLRVSVYIAKGAHVYLLGIRVLTFELCRELLKVLAPAYAHKNAAKRQHMHRDFDKRSCIHLAASRTCS